jgi:hypothetical protein
VVGRKKILFLCSKEKEIGEGQFFYFFIFTYYYDLEREFGGKKKKIILGDILLFFD